MNKDAQTSDESMLTPAQRDRLDESCDAFESQWQEQSWPQVFDYLEGIDDPLRSVILRELLKIDAHWRRQASDTRRLRSELLNRFPTSRQTVEQILGADRHANRSLMWSADSLGHFERLEKIGDGGFGLVYRAWDARHQRQVALKIPRFAHQLIGRELEEFFREAKAAGSLDHPNIARVWDSGTIAGVTYIAYQLVEGDNLKLRLMEFSQKRPLEIAQFIRQLSLAVQYAHDQGIIHRDIKPSNVLITKDNQPILADFGLALAVGADATRSLAARIGTLDYMSPEQATGAQELIGEQTDVWSLGVVMYELLTGELPFQGATDLQLCGNICDAPHRNPRVLRQEIPKDLGIVIERCLQKRPSDRLASAGDLASELAQIESGRPIRSRRVSFVERAIGWCRRNPRPMAAFAAILLATVFGAWSWGLRLAESQQNENVVQQLQLQLEAKNAERRELLTQLLSTNPAEISLLQQDLVFLENQMLSSSSAREQLLCAEVLVRHAWISAERFPPNSSKRNRVIEILERLRSSSSSSSSKETRLEDAVQDTLDSLAAPVENESQHSLLTIRADVIA